MRISPFKFGKRISIQIKKCNMKKAITTTGKIRDFMIPSFDFTSQEEKYQKNSLLERRLCNVCVKIA
jgi:hypothetical protein